jgi:urease alpha subunit
MNLGRASRREVLTELAAMGASTLLPSAEAQILASRAINCHSHFASPAYIKALPAGSIGRCNTHLIG